MLNDENASVKPKGGSVALFCIITALYWFSLYAYIPIFTPYVESLGAGHTMTGLIVGSYGLTQLLLRIPLGIISDRLRKRKIFVSLGMLLSLGSSLGLWLVPGVWGALIFRGLAGAAASTWVAFTVLFSSYFNEGQAQKAIGTINAFNSLGQMLATFAGGWLAQSVGWPSTFILAAIVGAIGLVASLFVAETRVPTKQPIQVEQLLKVGKSVSLLTVSGLAILSQFVTFATVFGFTTVHAQSIGAGEFEMGLLTLISTLPYMLASTLVASVFATRFGERRTVTIGFVIVAVCAAIIPFTRSMSGLYISQAIGGFGRGMVFPVLMGLSIKTVEPDKRATAMGFFQAIYAVGMFVGPFLVGLISDAVGLTGGFLATAAVGAVAAFVAWASLKPLSRSI
jgi:MFS family permease